MPATPVIPATPVAKKSLFSRIADRVAITGRDVFYVLTPAAASFLTAWAATGNALTTVALVAAGTAAGATLVRLLAPELKPSDLAALGSVVTQLDPALAPEVKVAESAATILLSQPGPPANPVIPLP